MVLQAVLQGLPLTEGNNQFLQPAGYTPVDTAQSAVVLELQTMKTCETSLL